MYNRIYIRDVLIGVVWTCQAKAQSTECPTMRINLRKMMPMLMFFVIFGVFVHRRRTRLLVTSRISTDKPMMSRITTTHELMTSRISTDKPMMSRFSNTSNATNLTDCKLELRVQNITSSIMCSGQLYLNGRLQTAWTFTPTTQMVIMFHVAKGCKLNGGRYQQESTAMDAQSLALIADFLSSVPDKDYVAGMGNLRLLQRVNLTIAQVTPNNETEILFIARRGYPGLTKTSRSIWNETLSHDLYCANPFPYDLSNTTFENVVNHNPDFTSKTLLWQPKEYLGLKWRVAIIVPFRNRYNHLWIFLENIIRFLKLQHNSFRIFVIDQAGPQLFNRAALMNIGFIEASKLADFNCFIFHDVDLIPEDLANIYSCADQPRHLAVSRSVMQYKYAVSSIYEYLGGAIAMTPRQILTINGFPSYLFGWGGEDDEILGRLRLVKLKVLRYPGEVGTYHSLPHDGEEEGNPHVRTRYDKKMYRLAKTKMKTHGYNSTSYYVSSIKHTSIYTHISVNLEGPTDIKDVLF